MAARPHRRLTLVADPGFPAELAQRVAPELPEALARGLPAAGRWDVDVVSERLVVVEQAVTRLSPDLVGNGRQPGRAVSVALTDQPQRVHTRVVIATANPEGGIALVSLPGLGAHSLGKRLAEMVVMLTGELVGNDAPEVVKRGPRSLRRVAEPSERDIRFEGSGLAARVRLLAGMVRANRPWRLVPQLSGAFAGALATAAYVVVSAFLWRIADRAGPLRLALTNLFAVVAMVAWLIAKHRLWERPSDRGARRLAALYNVVTAVSLAAGVLCLYAGVLVLSFLGEVLLVRSSIFQESLGHAVGWKDYAAIAWLAASMATVGGAIGSGLDSDEIAREAAYGYRQRQRSRDLREESRCTGDDEEVGARGEQH
ncbi:MAG TPA: hypothetical protein VHT97_04280 [Acidimicrobiales bacterium]|jgi:hypothetical protein|nr:hypothetical protein [Acidimicrobiales bacterium]